ncbi:MAG: hypothetical protein K0R50_3543 [Eubacterium sp.]|jgi:hypothetical protein|nr:hypothetical protein [Eubacterium sp.]
MGTLRIEYKTLNKGMVKLMINRKQIQREQVMKAIEKGDFEGSLLTTNDKVVIVLTQDWCPQWHDMKGWIYRIDIDQEIDVYELEYNRTDYFDDFRNFKENVWNNHTIPYLRFYRNGILYKETNYISEGQFSEVLGM